MNLFINYFEHKESRRKKELDFCLDKNESNPLIENIVIVNENKRATFGDFFQAMQPYAGQINIIANLDIYFDESLEHANKLKGMEVYALTRWELIGERIIDFNGRHGRHIPAQWSQDAWIFKTIPNFRNFNEVTAVNLNNNRRSEIIPFHLGVPGCDNKLAAMLRHYSFNVLNPSLQIKAIHVHETDLRTYPHYQIMSGIRPNGLVYQTKI